VPEEEALALIARGTTLAAGPEEGGATQFEIEARSWFVLRHIEAAEVGDEAAAQRWMDRATGFARAAQDAGDEDLGGVASLAEELDIARRWPEAAEVYRRLIDAASLEDESVQQLALREGELRLMTGDPA